MRILIMLVLISVIVLFFFLFASNTGKNIKELENNKITIEQKNNEINTKNDVIRAKNRQQDMVNSYFDNIDARVDWLHLVYEKGEYDATQQ